MNKSNKITDLRQEWEQMSTKDLEALLHTELESTQRDDDVVIVLLHILEGRERGSPLKLTPCEAASYERYREKVRKRSAGSQSVPRWISVAASLLLIMGLLFSMLPQQAEAETLWEMLSRWKESVLQFFNPDEKIIMEAYEFQTDHPGLQQVYDAVVELGIKEPVVPMWIPEAYELTDLSNKSTPKLMGAYAEFSYDEMYLIYKAEIYADGTHHEYYIDDSYSESYEIDGMTYNIARNNEWWVVVWTKENIECSIALDCQEETLRRILDSIYTMEDN